MACAARASVPWCATDRKYCSLSQSIGCKYAVSCCKSIPCNRSGLGLLRTARTDGRHDMRQIDHHIVGGAGGSARKSDIFDPNNRSEEHKSELQSLMRNSYAVFCLKKITTPHNTATTPTTNT